MAKRRKKAPKKRNGALKIYLGIIFCIIVIIFTFYIVLKEKSNINLIQNNQTIQNIRHYLNDEKYKFNKNNLKISDANLSFEAKKKIKEQNETYFKFKKEKDENLDQNKSGLSLLDLNKSENNAVNAILKLSNTKQKLLSLDTNKSKYVLKEENSTKIPQKLNKISNKPKLTLIIDDITSAEQIQNINAIGLKITPSIFPPTKNYPHTAKLTKKVKFYMIHLPLEAMHFGAEPNTLYVGDSQKKIDNRISTIKMQFPNLRFINNHTGSKFTSDYNSVKKLLISLKKHHILFLDSFTIKDSVVKKVSDELGLKYVRRDVFIDNNQNVKKILDQIKIAVDVAKKNGHAIAIGHPHKMTFKALNIAKNGILKDVDIIYLKDIYGLYN